MAWEEPPPRDPKMLHLGRRLRDDEVPYHCCDPATLDRLIRERPRDLPFAVQDNCDSHFYVTKFAFERHDEMMMFWKADYAVIIQQSGNIWGKVWPLFGFTVDSGRGWLWTLMETQFNLCVIQPLQPESWRWKVASKALARASPNYEPFQPLRRHEHLYVLCGQEQQNISENLRLALKRRGCNTKKYQWLPATMGSYDAKHKFTLVTLQNNSIKRINDSKAHHLKVIYCIPPEIVDAANMLRMTVMFYAVRLDAALERGPAQEIVRWNPFRYIGAELCAQIARFLDCRDASGVLLDEYRQA